jgi:hypothetical protein
MMQVFTLKWRLSGETFAVGVLPQDDLQLYFTYDDRGSLLSDKEDRLEKGVLADAIDTLIGVRTFDELKRVCQLYPVDIQEYRVKDEEYTLPVFPNAPYDDRDRVYGPLPVLPWRGSPPRIFPHEVWCSANASGVITTSLTVES